MSTPPPPPPFGYTQGQPADGASYDRRAVRAQRRAAADQARLQRLQMRQQIRAARRTSIVGPLLLVALGTVLLMLQMGRLHWAEALAWLAGWWPAILVFAGVLMLLEWTLDRYRMSSARAAFVPQRLLGGGAATLLILIALAGACVMAAEHGSAWAQRNLGEHFAESGFGNWPQLLGARTELDTDLRAPLASDGSLTIEDPHGDVTVTGSSPDGQVHVTAHQHMYLWHAHDTEERRRAEQIRFSGGRDRLLLSAPSQEEDSADLTVRLPHNASLIVHSGRGDIEIDELHGSVEASAGSGDVKLTALSGPVHLSAQDDNADITAHSLANGLTLNGRTGDLNLSDIDGPVILRGDFFGTSHLEGIRGTVHFQSSFTDFACAGIPGDLNIEGRSDLDAHHVDGPVTLATTNRNLTLDGLRGAATISDRNGSVNLTLAGAAEPVRITNQNGSVELSVPSQDSFRLDARTENGVVEDEFKPAPTKVGERSQAMGDVGHGGPAVSLQTTEGDIKIHRSDASDAAGWGDQPPRITETPTAPALSAHPAGSAKQHSR